VKLASDELWYLWEQGNFVGANRPLARVVITKQTLQTSNDLFRTELFGDANYDWYEIPAINIKSLSRNHRVGTDAATMNLEMVNASPISTGENLDVSYDGDALSPTKRELGEIGVPGKFTYRRGLSSDGSGRNPWGHEASEFVDMFLPNRLIRTFEGYGTDGSHEPWEDSKQVLTGTWLIDKVNIDANGDFSVECRDLAKLLIEQRLYPPIVPLDNYPIEFCSDSEETTTNVIDGTSSTISTPAVVGDNVAQHSSAVFDSSAAPWYGTNASVYGHRASHAFDGDPTTYWISMRNSIGGISTDWSFEWLDADTGGNPVNRIRFRPWKGNYVLYVCVKENGVWQGDAKVPYNPNAGPAYPNTADTNYVMKQSLPVSENWWTIDLPRVYNADTVRLTFTNLQDFGAIPNGDYRAGVYEFEVMGYTPAGSTTTTTEDSTEELVTFLPGNITDYTDIIKLFLAWSGFYWPVSESDDQSKHDPLFLMEEWGSRGGRVWGDFFYSGAYPVEPACIDGAYWDNKSVMDGINQIKEILGFIGYVDATGGFVWRPPNIWANGNYITGVGWQGETSIPIVSENTLLMDYGVTIDDAALRSEIIVIADGDPTVYGSYSPGYAEGEESPQSIEGSQSNFGDEQVVTDLGLLAGQQRVMLVPDYPFGQGYEDEVMARAEVEKFAYLVSLWIHWSYRKGKIRIPANPALDVDDQIRVYEAKTSETYIHYILGMNVSLDMQSGSYTADVDTHWLGNGPEASWHMFINDLPPALLAYLCQQKILEGGPCPDSNEAGEGQPFVLEPPVVPNTPIEIPRTPIDLIVPYPSIPNVGTAPPVGDGGGDGDDDGWETPPSDTGGGTVTSCSNAFMFSFWGNHTQPSSRRRFNGDGSSYSYTVLDNRAWAAFELLSDLFDEENITVYSASGKVVRHVKNVDGSYGATWSNHSWGTANDINSSQLPHGKSIHSYSSSVKNPYLDVWAKAQNIRGWDSSAAQFVPVFTWGQYFSTPDPMHWQICAKASHLSLGVWDLAKGYPPPLPQ
jgi:hypothetical protein